MMVMFFSINFVNAQNKTLENDSTLMLKDSLQSRSGSLYENYLPALPTVVHPTTTSMALQKYLDFPVSHATGLVDISIPLYELKEKFVSLPIELKYHSSGIKVQDSPGTVGLGWTLHPGLKISRTIYGKPDDGYPVKNLNVSSISPQSLADLKELIYMATPASESDHQVYPLPGDLNANKRSDGQYDIFTIHLPHRSASFILKYTGNHLSGTFAVQMIPESPLVIEPLILPINQILGQSPNLCNLWLYGFTVQDEFGNTYYFGEEVHKNAIQTPQYIEYTEQVNFMPSWAIGWMLRKIVQPNGEEILFTYTNLFEYDRINQNFYQVTDNVGLMYGQMMTYSNFSSLVDDDGYRILNPYPSGTGGVNTKIISSINSPTTEMNFLYTNTPSLPGKKPLSSLTVRDKFLENQIQNISFSVNKSNCNITGALGDFYLSEVNIPGLGQYKFEYFPCSNSWDYDWWGYYNNGGSGYIGIPLMTVQHSGPNFSGIEQSGSSVIGTGSREPDVFKMPSGALNKVIYPTGGYFKIDYQAHQATYDGNTKTVGGLRVSKTYLYDPVSDKTITKQYTYDKPRAITAIYPTPESLIKSSTICLLTLSQKMGQWGIVQVPEFYSARSRIVTPFSPHSYYSPTSLLVWYEKVTEIHSEGSTVYTFDYKPSDMYKILIDDPYNNYYHQEINHLFYSAPRLLTMTHFNNKFQKVQKVKHTYSSSTPSSIQGWIATPVKRLFDLENFCNGCITSKQNSDFLCAFNHYPLSGYPYEIFPKPIAYGSYNIKHGIITLSSTQTVTYNGNDSIVEMISYTYDPNKKYNLRSKTVTTNTGDLTETYYYPYDNTTIPDRNVLTSTQQSNISLMNNKNYKTTVIQQILKKGNSTLFSKITGFAGFSSNPDLFLPETDYFKEIPHSTYGGSNLIFEPRIRFHSYDQYGNPTCVSNENGSMIIYIWGYKGQYPVAKIETSSNLSSFYTTVTNAIGTTNTNTLNGNPTDKMVRTIFTNLRANSKMTNAFITSYTYKPLVGMTSETDPSGRTIFYEYDDFSRLIRVKDDAGKILKEYRYNYAQ